MTTILVSGARDYPADDTKTIEQALSAGLTLLGSGTNPNQFHNRLIHGAARGLDTMAGTQAKQLGFHVDEFPAKWNEHDHNCPPWHMTQETCKMAGHRRNAEMISEARLRLQGGEPTLMIAFPTGRKSEGVSKGTWGAIDTAIPTELPVFVQYQKSLWPGNDPAKALTQEYARAFASLGARAGSDGQVVTEDVAKIVIPF